MIPFPVTFTKSWTTLVAALALLSEGCPVKGDPRNYSWEGKDWALGTSTGPDKGVQAASSPLFILGNPSGRALSVILHFDTPDLRMDE